jgi:hypothetical protein
LEIFIFWLWHEAKTRYKSLGAPEDSKTMLPVFKNGGAPMPRKLTPAQAAAIKTRKPKAPVKCKQNDIARAVRAAQKNNLPVSRVEIDPTTGKIAVVIGGNEIAATASNPWDSVLKNETAERTA